MKLETPYYAVIFTSQKRNLSETQAKAYNETADNMCALAKTMPGYIGFEGSYQENGYGITVSYWESESAIKNWRDNLEHAEAQRRGSEDWYKDYKVRIAKVERAYEW